jgi:hypothetical protein
MKIIEGLKKVKDLERKVGDLAGKVKENAAISSLDTEKYANQGQQVREWLDTIRDTIHEISRLRCAIQTTNLAVKVDIELEGKQVNKTIAAWIHRRRDLAKMECGSWAALTDRGIKEGMVNSPTGQPIQLSIKRFYDPAERDKRIEALTQEVSLIDARLEIVNAVTDLQE